MFQLDDRPAQAACPGTPRPGGQLALITNRLRAYTSARRQIRMRLCLLQTPQVRRLGDGTGLLVTKITSGQAGYIPGRLTMNKKRKLTKQETDRFLYAVDQNEFWNLAV